MCLYQTLGHLDRYIVADAGQKTRKYRNFDQSTNFANFVKLEQGVPCTPLYIPKFSKIFSFWSPIVAPMGVKFDTNEWTEGALLHAKFHPHRRNVSLLRGEKKSLNRPLRNLNTVACSARNAAGNKRDSTVVTGVKTTGESSRRRSCSNTTFTQTQRCGRRRPATVPPPRRTGVTMHGMMICRTDRPPCRCWPQRLNHSTVTNCVFTRARPPARTPNQRQDGGRHRALAVRPPLHRRGARKRDIPFHPLSNSCCVPVAQRSNQE